ncbi:VOC family protein [Sphingomonas sp. RS2018]
MPKEIFVNLPVTDVARSTAFYQALGFEKNDMFSNEQASAMTWSDGIAVMLLDTTFYVTFTPKRIIDAHSETGVLLALAFDSRAEVDTITDAAIAAGGREAHDPEDEGYMYSRAFEDPDGHGWGPFFMDMDAAKTAFAADAPADA